MVSAASWSMARANSTRRSCPADSSPGVLVSSLSMPAWDRARGAQASAGMAASGFDRQLPAWPVMRHDVPGNQWQRQVRITNDAIGREGGRSPRPWGGTVNVASRMEGTRPLNPIRVSAPVRGPFGDDFLLDGRVRA